MFKYLKGSLYSVIILLISSIIITIFNYLDILKGNTLHIIELLIPLISIFIGSYIIGKLSSNKGYIVGIKYGIIWTIIYIITSIIFNSISPLTIVYLCIILITSISGAIIGINKKR